MAIIVPVKKPNMDGFQAISYRPMGDLGSRVTRWQWRVITEIKIYTGTSNSFLYSAFYNFMYTFKGFNKIYQLFPDM